MILLSFSEFYVFFDRFSVFLVLRRRGGLVRNILALSLSDWSGPPSGSD